MEMGGRIKDLNSITFSFVVLKGSAHRYRPFWSSFGIETKEKSDIIKVFVQESEFAGDQFLLNDDP